MTARRARNGYDREETLVADLAQQLLANGGPWGVERLTFEFDYHGGYTDVVAQCRSGDLVAFEAKLSRWREALHQAYRTLCFAQRSYVALPVEVAHVAARFEHEFRRRRVGLCSVSAERGIQVVVDADHSTPFQPWIAAQAIADLAAPPGEKTRCRQTQNFSRLSKRFAPDGSSDSYAR